MLDRGHPVRPLQHERTQTAALLTRAADGKPYTATLSGLGTYRLLAVPGQGGTRLRQRPAAQLGDQTPCGRWS